MLKQVGEYLAGRVTFELWGGQGERFLNECASSEIPIQHICVTELGYRAQVPMRDYKKLHRIARKYRCRMRMTSKRGAYCALWVYRKRWGILAGAAVACLALFVFSRMIWSVQFYDFTAQEQTFLRQQLYEKNISEGSIVSAPDLKSIQNQLFVQNQGYGWIKLNFVHGRLVVEKSKAEQRPPSAVHENVTSIVALCDGWIDYMEVSGGYIQRTKGQYVAQDDVIISGAMVSPKGTVFTANAQAKVYALVERTYEVRQPLQIEKTVPSAQQQSYYAVRFAGLYLPFYREVEAPANSTQLVAKYPLQFLGLPLPATVEETRVRGTQQISYTLTEEQAAEIARAAAYDTMAKELPELKVLTHEETMECTDGVLVLRMKMTGRANIAKTVTMSPEDFPVAEIPKELQ